MFHTPNLIGRSRRDEAASQWSDLAASLSLSGGGDPSEALLVRRRRPGPELHQRAHRQVLPLSQVGGAAGLRLHLPGVWRLFDQRSPSERAMTKRSEKKRNLKFKWPDSFILTTLWDFLSASAPPPGRGGGRLHAYGAVQPAPPAQPAQPLLRPGGQRARAGGQGPAAERHGERCARWEWPAVIQKRGV